MVCDLTQIDGRHNWCERHKMFHDGHYRDYALDPGEKGARFRVLWSKIAAGENPLASQLPRLLRSLPLAKQCIYLGERLTAEEVKEKQLAGCRTCSGEVPAFHCKLPGAKKFNNGPYTRLAECMNCNDWRNPSIRHLPINGDWIKAPDVWQTFRQMIQEELSSYE